MAATITVTFRTALATCIGLAFAAIPSLSDATLPNPAGGTTWMVENCNDAGPGSLREVLAGVGDGDGVDLTQLACSTITLTTGELTVTVDHLALSGNHVTIDAAGASRVLSHTGTGVLSIYGVNLTNGASLGAGSGGCLSSLGSVSLTRATVSGCTAKVSPAGPFGAQEALGGGVYAAGNLSVAYTIISGNTALIAGGSGYYDVASGGGLAALGNLRIDHSTIAGNEASGGTIYVNGGGFWSSASVTIVASTVNGNHAFVGGAGEMEGFSSVTTGSSIVDSTISGNTSEFRVAGIESFDSVLRIENSTIAFNVSNNTSDGFVGGVGVATFGFQNLLYLGSSIIADNTTIDGVADDLCWQGESGGGVLGRNNLILASCNNFERDDTLHADPILAPLADNGGPTMTHALLPGSPAIDRGSNLSQLVSDQRGQPRVAGPAADIGALEVQQLSSPDAIFRDGFDVAS